MWVALNYVFSPHWCQNIQYHSLLKCFWNPKAERHSIKILLWLFSELDFHCVASSSNFFSPVGNSFSTVREFWFSLSLSLLKEGKRWGEEEEKKKLSFLRSWSEIYDTAYLVRSLAYTCYPHSAAPRVHWVSSVGMCWFGFSERWMLRWR